MIFEYTDAHGISQSDPFQLQSLESDLIEQCKAWNSYDLQALKDHSGIYFQFIIDYLKIFMSFEALEGSRLIICSYTEIGDRHYRINIPKYVDSEHEIAIRGLGMLETSEPPTFQGSTEQKIMIHNKMVKIYFAQFRCYEVDFIMQRFFVHCLKSGYLT